MWEVAQPARVIVVKMRHHDKTHIAGRDAQLGQLGADLLVWRDPGVDAASEERVEAGHVASVGLSRTIAGVNQD